MVAKDTSREGIDYFVEALSMEELGIEEKNEETGRPSYSPRVMLKILLYGYSEGGRSSRRLERLSYENIAYIWLTGNLYPDYRAIARFREKNIGAMNGLLKKTIELYEEWG